MNNNEQNKPLTKKERREKKRQEKLARRAAQAKSKWIGQTLIWGGVLALIGLMVWGMTKIGSGLKTEPASGALDPVASADWQIGNKSSKIVLVEYSDYQCPACAAAEPTLQALRKEFGNRVNFVYRSYPLAQHQFGYLAAEAAEAAGKQGKYWEMHDLLFARQATWSLDAKPENLFLSYAGELGLNKPQYVKDFYADETRNLIVKQMESAARAGVKSTPTFFLNGQGLTLSRFEDLREAILSSIK